MIKHRLVNNMKSPCAHHPNSGFGCKHINKDKDIEPCSSCKLPRDYDDKISFGIKRFTPLSAKRGVRSKAQGRLHDMARQLGCVSLQHYIERLQMAGYTYNRMAELCGVSKASVLRNKDNKRAIL